MNRVPVAVLLGGPSAEHDVSLVSGRAIAAALAGRGHDVTGWLIDLAGRWWRLPPSALDMAHRATDYDDPAGLGADGPHAAADALSTIAAAAPAPVVFIALHGPFGEDGVVQALCEAAGLIYTGSGVAASAVGMDKAVFKRIASAIGYTGRAVDRGCRQRLARRPGVRSAPDRRLHGLPRRPPRHRQAGPPWFIGRYFDRSPPR